MVFDKDVVDGEDERLKGCLPYLWLQLTFPYRDTMPPHAGKPFLLLLVPASVAFNLRLPEGGPALWHDKKFAAFMAVPKTAVDKDDRAILAHHDVRMSRQPRVVHPIPEPVRKQIAAHHHFGFGCLAVYGCHAAASLLLCHLVHCSAFD